MGEHQLIRQAGQCRVRILDEAKRERDGLPKIADGIGHIASVAEARRAIEETRCW